MFGDIVAIASDADAFFAACRQSLRESAAQKAARQERMRDRVAKHSWDAAAETIRRSLEAVLAAPRASEPASASTPAGVARARVASVGADGTDTVAGRTGSTTTPTRKVASAG
jgi:hypothetical protein